MKRFARWCFWVAVLVGGVLAAIGGMFIIAVTNHILGDAWGSAIGSVVILGGAAWVLSNED